MKKAVLRGHLKGWVFFHSDRATHCRAQSVAANACSSRDVGNPSQKRPCRNQLATPLAMSRGNVLAKTDRATRGVAAALTPIALHCATKLCTGNFNFSMDRTHPKVSHPHFRISRSSEIAVRRFPKHLLVQNCPRENWANFPFHNFPLKVALPFPWNGLFSHEMKGV